MTLIARPVVIAIMVCSVILLMPTDLGPEPYFTFRLRNGEHMGGLVVDSGTSVRMSFNDNGLYINLFVNRDGKPRYQRFDYGRVFQTTDEKGRIIQVRCYGQGAEN